jgi:hypothetical protein
MHHFLLALCRASRCALLGSLAAALPRVLAAQILVPDDSLPEAQTLRAAQRAMVTSLVQGDSTMGAARWCPEYQSLTRGVSGGRDSVFRQFAPRHRGASPVGRFLPVDTTVRMTVRFASDTSAWVIGTYEQAIDRDESRSRTWVTLMHEFRRRPSGWCAVRGRTIKEGEELP